MPVSGCFDYTGLVIQFDIRYCDPSYFVLLSQNCCSYLGSLMVPYEFLKCLFCICEMCHGYFNRDCIESINRFGQYGHFDDVNSSNPWAWYMLPFVCVFLNFFLQCCVVFWVRSSTSLVRFIPRYLIFLVAISNGIFFLISVSAVSLYVYRNAFDFLVLTLNPAILPNSFLGQVAFWWSL